MKFSGLKPDQSTFIDALGKRVISASLNGISFEVKDYDGQTIYLPPLAAENELNLIWRNEEEFAQLNANLTTHEFSIQYSDSGEVKTL